MGGNQKRIASKTSTTTTVRAFVTSQLVLFQSRKKFAFLYCLATISGLFCIPGVLEALHSGFNLVTIVRMTLPLPLASLLVTAGTYILNDLVDVDLDRANGKNRPIASGKVSKRQALTFVLSCFVSAIMLTASTSNTNSLVIVTLMVAIGIAYSAPRIALMNRFIVKTVSIALFYILCGLLGVTSSYNFDLAIDRPILIISVLLTMALMVFISSTLNDLGDIAGDKAARRRTIPVVIGKDSTIKLTIALAISVLATVWAFYVASVATGNHQISFFSVSITSFVGLVVMVTLIRMRDASQNSDFVRKQHKQLFPLQMAIHPAIISGIMIV